MCSKYPNSNIRAIQFEPYIPRRRSHADQKDSSLTCLEVQLAYDSAWLTALALVHSFIYDPHSWWLVALSLYLLNGRKCPFPFFFTKRQITFGPNPSRDSNKFSISSYFIIVAVNTFVLPILFCASIAESIRQQQQPGQQLGQQLGYGGNLGCSQLEQQDKAVWFLCRVHFVFR